VPVSARVNRNTLVVEGIGEGGATLKEVLALSPDGQSLTIAITAASAKGAGSSTLVYRRANKAAPCQSWPTPCR
jgi:hypothetical protein